MIKYKIKHSISAQPFLCSTLLAHKAFTLLLFFWLYSIAAQGQDTMAIPAENVEVVKRYEAAIAQAKRKKINFQKKDKVLSPLAYNYNVTTEKVIDFERPDPEIKALGYKGIAKVKKDVKNGYLYGGYGSHATLNAGAAYHYYIEDWLEAGLKIDHFSSMDSLSLGLFNYANTDVNAYAGYSLGEHTRVKLSGHSEYSRHAFYSGREADSIAIIPVDKYGVDLGFSHNVFEKHGFALRTGVAYKSSHHKLDSLKDKTYQAKLNILKTINDKMSVELPILYQRIGFDSIFIEPISQNVSDLVLSPNFRLRGSNFSIKAGINYITGDSVSIIFPLVHLSMTDVVGGVDISLFSEIDYQRNSLYNLSDLNPYFLASFSDYSPSVVKSYSLQARRKIKSLTGELTISFNNYTNEVIFVDDYLTPRSNFKLVDRDEIAVTPRITYNLDDKIEVGLSATYNFFLTDSLDLFYRQKFELQLSGKESLLNGKLTFDQSLKYVGSRAYNTAYDWIDVELPDGGKLDGYLDLALGFNYQVSPVLSVYGKGVNIIGSSYELWRFQPVFETQLWGGIKVKI